MKILCWFGWHQWTYYDYRFISPARDMFSVIHNVRICQQPKGQRVEDKLKWAQEMFQLYATANWIR